MVKLIVNPQESEILSIIRYRGTSKIAPMNISVKFGSNLFCGFRKKDENVKFP
jgi:hypothetical protein